MMPAPPARVPSIPPAAVRTAGVAVGSGLAAALALALPLVAGWEGKRNDPYLDIVKVPTVCFGETQVAMRHYSDGECRAMLERRLREDYAAPVLACAPQLADRPYQLAAAASLAYNIGARAFCGSSAARAFRARQWRAGCRAIAKWNSAGGRVVQGLVNRRAAEVRLCLTGL